MRSHVSMKTFFISCITSSKTYKEISINLFTNCSQYFVDHSLVKFKKRIHNEAMSCIRSMDNMWSYLRWCGCRVLDNNGIRCELEDSTIELVNFGTMVVIQSQPLIFIFGSE